MMQAFFMDNIPAEEVIFQLKAYQKEREQRLAKMKRILDERWESIRERNVMNSRILVSSTVIRRGLEQEIQYIRWCRDTIELVESCSALWSQDSDKPGSPDDACIRFTDVEPLFQKYYGDLKED
ncbi:MAG: hypothetical protein LBJ26_04905 [Paenibacillus sp.]|nr:hypothetical protein [Paenibacillus sp.]